MTHTHTCLAAALLLALSPAALAAKLALVGGTLVDGTLAEPIRDSVIIVDGERIVAVGTVASLPVPADAEVVSTEGMTVLPGLWDMHVHLMINGHADYAYWDKKYLPQLREVIMPASAEQLLMAGITSARDLGAPLDDLGPDASAEALLRAADEDVAQAVAGLRPVVNFVAQSQNTNTDPDVAGNDSLQSTLSLAAQWTLFGISLAGFNAIFSLGAAALVLTLLRRRPTSAA